MKIITCVLAKMKIYDKKKSYILCTMFFFFEKDILCTMFIQKVNDLWLG